jgi:hypothetical protein
VLILEEFFRDLRRFDRLLCPGRKDQEKRQREQREEATEGGHGRFPEERGKVEKL